ncbi:MAG: alpha/beta hydrolase [Acidimicrobiia bacterium]
MASRESGYLRDLYKSWADRLAASPEADIATVRDIFEEWHLPTREPEGVTYAEVDAGGTPAIWCIPGGCASDRVLLYNHGGGCVVGSMYSHRKLAGHLAKATGARALVLDYRRAPEHPFPSQIEENVAVYRWLLDQGIRPEHIATVGDSAGGNLSITVVLKLRQLGQPLPAAIVPLSPYLDMELSGETMDSRAATDALVSRPLAEQMVGLYIADASPVDPLANPLHADLSGLPPAYVEAGDDEMLLDDAVRFAQLAEKAGVDVTLNVEPGMQHVFQCLAGRAPEADRAVAAIGAWLRPKLGLG